MNSAQANSEWSEWFRAGGFIHAIVPSVPAPGNHEYRPLVPEEEDEDAPRQLSVFWRPQFTLPRNGPAALPESSYTFDYQGARFVVLNSNEEQETQADSLDSVLGDEPQKWTIVAFHHPIFSSGGDRDNARLRGLWKPVLDEHRVDLVLQGHDHTYARGRSGEAEVNTLTGTNGVDPVAGTVYIVSVSGAKMYEFKPDQWGPVRRDARPSRGEHPTLSGDPDRR